MCCPWQDAEWAGQPGPFLVAALAQGRVLEPVDQQQGQEVASVSHVRRFLSHPKMEAGGVFILEATRNTAPPVFGACVQAQFQRRL